MFRNFVLITLRNLRKNGTYSFINIAGLSIGIACSLLIMLWVFDELSFNTFQPKANRLYQVWINAKFDGKINSWTSVPQPTYEALKTEDSNILNTAISDWGGERLFGVGDNRVNKRTYFVSEEFLEMFQFPLIKGDASLVLDDPNSIVISESMAKILFGDEDPLNQTVRVDDAHELKVTGVLRDIPKNSSLQFDCLMTWEHKRKTEDWVKESIANWGNYSFQVYVELNDPSKEEVVESAIEDLLTRKGETDIKREFYLHPLLRWRLHSNFENGKEAGGMVDYVNMFTIIALFILVIACINFMNLATARSERRAREVGIRKSVGSRRHELVFQFMGESIFLACMAFVIAMLIAHLVLPFYNELVQKQLFIDYQAPRFWIFAAVLVSFTGIVSGSYPALYLSSFQPVQVLKGKVRVGRGATTPRKILVTLQFGFSILLIIGTLVIYWQIKHVKGRDLGYNQENLITIDYTAEVGRNYRTIKQELLSTGVVKSVCKSNSPITEIWSNNFLGWPGKPEDQKVIFSTIATEYDYTQTMGIKILQGRDFSEDFKSDTSAIIINKAALDVMGLKDPLGAQLDLWGSKRNLIGIVDNVLMGSPYQPVKPMFVVFQPEWSSAVSIRLEKTNDLPASIRKVVEIFNKYNPAYHFEYSFADVEFAKKFTTINMTSRLASLFASLAILITGLGLFGLAAFMAEQRTKEIGIRKVMGASVSSLVTLMSMDFSKLVLAAFALASPLAWWLLNDFLERYPYRIAIPWWVFPLTGVVALVFATVIVSTQAFRAARANPVNSLRNE
ncbi:MAG: FtsX-like permease family protein [Cytophagales bacterium]|nr:FtsX-like permease family protein [Cytophagales bacterium]